MDQPDRPARPEPDPDVRRDRQRRRDPARPQVELDREARDHAAAREPERPGDEVIGVRARARAPREEDRDDDERATHRATLTWPIALAALAAACRSEVGALEGVFYDGDGRTVHCATNLDTIGGNSLASIDAALDRAAARGEVVELYAHRPGVTVPMATLEHVLAGARDRNLAFVTYADFAAGREARPGLALSFDDAGVHDWIAARPLFQRHGARVTFFVTRYATLWEEEHALIRELAGDGHDIAAHGVMHQRAPDYVEDHGLRAYLDEEVLPSIEVLREDGYEVTSFAYPYGARTDEIDRALAGHVPVLRSVSFSLDGVFDPCPN